MKPVLREVVGQTVLRDNEVELNYISPILFVNKMMPPRECRPLPNRFVVAHFAAPPCRRDYQDACSLAQSLPFSADMKPIVNLIPSGRSGRCREYGNLAPHWGFDQYSH